nr:DACX1 [Dendrocalamus farinosus]
MNDGGYGGGGGGGGVMKKMSLLRVQYYCVLGAVAAALVLATLRYMPAPAAVTSVRSAAAPGGGGEHSIGAGASGQGDRKKKAAAGEVVLFNFGDSNSDTGGVAAVMGIHIAPPEGRAYFHHPTGRLSDGRVILDFICESLNTHHLSPYMKPLGSDFSNGVNFAIAGSTATPGDTAFSLDVQLDQFLFFKDRCLESIDRGETAPIDEKGFKNALYTMDIGHNDVTAILHLPYDKVLAKLPPIVTEIKKAIETLHKNGARKFWIHGTGALGCMPQKLAMPRDDDNGLDEHGCIARFNNACKKFNALLSEACDDLRLQMTDSTIVFVDMFAIKYDLVANHTKYGIEKPLMTCCGHGGPPYNYDPKTSCMTNDMDLCELGAKFISWDGVHFTDAANGIVAAKVLSGKYSIPRIKLTSLVKPARPSNL